MTHSIELLLDDAADRLLRNTWTALTAADIANQGEVRTDTNRPHVTLLAAHGIDGGALGALAPLAMRLPLTCRLGAPIVFGAGRGHTLARLVVPSTELLSIHATVNRLVAPSLTQSSAYSHSAPGHWTPHVTIARRLSRTQVAQALGVIEGEDTSVTFTAVRHWDGAAKTESILRGRDC